MILLFMKGFKNFSILFSAPILDIYRNGVKMDMSKDDEI